MYTCVKHASIDFTFEDLIDLRLWNPSADGKSALTPVLSF